MRKFALVLMLALFAAASTFATVSMPTSAIAQDKDKDKKKKADKKAATKADVPPTDGKKKEKKSKNAPGQCGTGMYFDKKAKKCADAGEAKKK